MRSAEDIYGLLDKGSAKRRTAATLLNKQSSRSHSVFCVTVQVHIGVLSHRILAKHGPQVMGCCPSHQCCAWPPAQLPARSSKRFLKILFVPKCRYTSCSPMGRTPSALASCTSWTWPALRASSGAWHCPQTHLADAAADRVLQAPTNPACQHAAQHLQADAAWLLCRSGATEERAKEAGSINKSLSALGRVINAIVDKTVRRDAARAGIMHADDPELSETTPSDSVDTCVARSIDTGNCAPVGAHSVPRLEAHAPAGRLPGWPHKDLHHCHHLPNGEDLDTPCLAQTSVLTVLVKHMQCSRVTTLIWTTAIANEKGSAFSDMCMTTARDAHLQLSDETKNTLEYALRAKNIRNRPEVNQKVSSATHMANLSAENKRLKLELTATREKEGVWKPFETCVLYVLDLRCRAGL